MVDIDKTNYAGLLKRFPEQIKEAVKISRGVKVFEAIDNIAVAGMGSSGMPGEMLKDYLPKLNIHTHHNYGLSDSIDRKTLLFICSYSGDTEETIDAFRKGLKQGANIVVITSGGKLNQLAKDNKKTAILLPTGYPAKSSLAYQFICMLMVLSNSRLIEEQTQIIDKTIKILGSGIYQERGKELAAILIDKIPLIYTSSKIQSVGRRWKTAFNQNSKTMAFSNTLPELNHSELTGFINPKGSFHVILLRDEEDNYRIAKRMKAVKEIIKENKVSVSEIALHGDLFLTRLLAAVLMGDWVSYYLALNYDIDPEPDEIIEKFKKKVK